MCMMDCDGLCEGRKVDNSWKLGGINGLVENDCLIFTEIVRGTGEKQRNID